MIPELAMETSEGVALLDRIKVKPPEGLPAASGYSGHASYSAASFGTILGKRASACLSKSAPSLSRVLSSTSIRRTAGSAASVRAKERGRSFGMIGAVRMWCPTWWTC